MSGTEPRDPATAALVHVRLAARELIAAARDTLDLLDDVVSTADLGGILSGITHLSRSVLGWRPPTSGTRPAAPPASGPGRPGRPPAGPESDSPVEHISVR